MSDKGPGQQVDVPQQLLLFMALHTEEKSVGQNSTDSSRFVSQGQ